MCLVEVTKPLKFFFYIFIIPFVEVVGRGEGMGKVFLLILIHSFILTFSNTSG